MYISRVEINQNNRRKIRDLTHIGAYHAWVEQSFPEEFDKQVRTRKLWRLDQLQGKHYLLMVSEDKPNLKSLEKYGVAGSAQTKSYDHFLGTLKNGNRMKFRVVLNPVIAISNRKHGRGKIKPLVLVEEQMKYLEERSEKNGFLLNENDFSVVERGYEIFKKATPKPVRLMKVIYEGTLTISDVATFRKVLTEGIGKKKAYGFGLMTVIPVGD